MFKKYLILISLIFISLNCSNPNRGKDYIAIGVCYEPESLLPLFPITATANDVNSLIFSSLLKLNDDLTTFSNDLAKSYEFSDDSLEIRFSLRSNIFWHDGEILTSEDVVYSHQLYTNKNIGWDGISYKQNISEVVATNDSTIIFKFTKKTPFMLLDAVEGEILPKHILSQIPVEELFQSNFAHAPIGSGPYKLTKWENQQYIQLDKNKKYFKNSKPGIPKIFFKFISEPAMQIQQLLNNEIDILTNIPPIYLDQLSNNSNEITVLDYKGKDYDFIGWNMINSESFLQLKDSIQSNPHKFIPKIKPHRLFGNTNIREALSLVVDKSLFTEKLFHGNAVPIYSPYVLFGNNLENQLQENHQLSLAKAKKLLSAEGWIDSDGNNILDKNGDEFIFTMYTNSGNIIREQILDILVQEFAKINIQMIPKKVEANFLVSDIIPNKKFDALLLGWNAGIKPDFTPLFHSSQYLHPLHLTGFYSPKFEAINKSLLQSHNFTEFTQHLDLVLKKLSSEYPYTWLYVKKNIFIYNKRIKNVETSIISPFRHLEDFEI